MFPTMNSMLHEMWKLFDDKKLWNKSFALAHSKIKLNAWNVRNFYRWKGILSDIMGSTMEQNAVKSDEL